MACLFDGPFISLSFALLMMLVCYKKHDELKWHKVYQRWDSRE